MGTRKFEMLYRSPNVLIDQHEWHIVVWRRGQVVSVVYRFRKPGITHTVPFCGYQKWRKLDEWQGPLPKGFREFFRHFKKSVEMARNSFGAKQKQAWAA